MSLKFENKVALVTAAADGIGKATAEAFAAQGAAVMLADINAELGEASAKQLRDGGANAAFFKVDGTLEDEVAALVQHTITTFGGLHLAANIIGDSRGDAHGPELHNQSLEGWEDTVAVSLRSTFLCLKHEIAHMIEHGGGNIVNVSSIAGCRYIPEGGAAYGAAKAGVVQLTKFAAVTYADRGVRVNCIAPGTTPTAAFEKGGPEAAKMLTERMLEGHAIKRVIKTSEQAAGIAWLCSDEASMITGHMLPIDGGWMAR